MCSELNNYRVTGDPEILNGPPATNNDNYPILREEVEAAVKSLKKGKSAGADNVPAELVQAGGEAVCNKIWQTGEWPTPGPNLSSSPSPRKATYSYARTIVPSASSVARAKLC